MSAIVILLGISILIAGGFLIAFIISVRNGQFDDKYTPAVRILFDDDTKIENVKSSDNDNDDTHKNISNNK